MSKSKFFSGCTSIEELKQQYKRLVKLHHPDCGGDMETMQAINSEYDFQFNILKNIHNSKAENRNRQCNEMPESFRGIITALMKMEGLIIEICGSWVWLSGQTYKHRALISEMGFRWSNGKKMWYLGETSSHRRRSTPMQDIRLKYGSDIYQSDPVFRLA